MTHPTLGGVVTEIRRLLRTEEKRGTRARAHKISCYCLSLLVHEIVIAQDIGSRASWTESVAAAGVCAAVRANAELRCEENGAWGSPV